MANTPTSTLVIVTGPAGAGRTTAIHVFEDLGFETIDNLPISFFESLLAGDGGAGRPLAIWIDSRTRGFSARALADLIATLRRRGGLETHLLLLDCADDVLLRRYSETRRKHPLARDDAPEDGIAAEKSLMEPLRELADDVIDTTDLSPHDLKDALR
ncbi:MAG: RNase adapter RapZ, partial [Rubricella sp.]